MLMEVPTQVKTRGVLLRAHNKWLWLGSTCYKPEKDEWRSTADVPGECFLYNLASPCL